MSKLPSVPDFTNEPESIGTAVRALKGGYEIMTGQTQGESLGAPQMFVQEVMPTLSRLTYFKTGDLWIKPSTRVMSYFDGREWVQLA